LYKRLDGLQNRSEGFGKEKNLLLLLGFRPQFLGFPGYNLFTLREVLSWVLIRLLSQFPEKRLHLKKDYKGDKNVVRLNVS
jgi:hypothetical protein